MADTIAQLFPLCRFVLMARRGAARVDGHAFRQVRTDFFGLEATNVGAVGGGQHQYIL